MVALREKRVGPYVVRELPMRETMRVMDAYPEVTSERGAALLGASVHNGNGQPLGLAVLDVGTGTYQALMLAYNEVNRMPDFDAEADPGNA